MNLTPKEQEELTKYRKLRAADPNAPDGFYWWMFVHWRTAKGKPLQWHNRRYLEQIYWDRHKNISVMKAAQVGISEWLLGTAFYVADKLKGNTGYFFPAEKQIGDFVQARVDPVIENSEYISNASKRGESSNKKFADKMSLKRINKGFVYFRGAQNPRQVTSIDLDCAVVDEYDRFEGVSLAMIEKRLNASELKWIRNGTTPTIEGTGIDLLMQETTYNEWHVRCPGCKKKQVLDYWHNVDEIECIIMCRFCEHPLPPEVINTGEWIPKFPKKKKQGYHVTGFLNPNIDIEALVENMNTSNEFKLQEAHNQDLGIPYVSTDRKLTDAVLDACQEDYSLPYQMNTITSCFAGLDVGKPSYLLIGTNDHKTKKPRIVGAFTLNDIETELPRYMRDYNIRSLVIDALPEQQLATKMVNAFHGRIYMSYYNYHDVVGGEFIRWNDGGSLQAHRTASMDEMYSNIYDGTLQLPKNAQYIPGLYDHLKAPKRIQSEIRGKVMYIYDEGGKPDHFAHALNYMFIARGKLPGSIKQNTDKNEQKSIKRNSYATYNEELSSVPHSAFPKDL